MSVPTGQRLASLRRSFHRYPEPSWCEFWTTARIVEELEKIGINEIYVGSEALEPSSRMHFPPERQRRTWHERAEAKGVNPFLLDRMEAGTGCIAVLDRGPGPHVGLRVDIDALPIEEEATESHRPASEGFHSRNDGYMHACGHDGHAAIGLGVIEAVASSSFSGKLTVLFQPAEEVLGGGKAMAEGPHTADLDALFAVHLGLGWDTGQVVAGMEKPLSVKEMAVTMHGKSAHAANAPNEGRNAIKAMATAVQSLYSVPRHEDGLTRVNVGTVEAGDAVNVIAETAEMDIEVRGGTNALAEYMHDEVSRCLNTSAAMHKCEVEVELLSEAPRVDSDQSLRQYVHRVAKASERTKEVAKTGVYGASEDATHLMRKVAESGGESSYIIVGTDHPSGHHTDRFDIDEESLVIAVDVLTRAICEYERPPGSTP